MFEGKTILSLIGARGGSKGLKNKNILALCGKPLIAWTIEASLASSYADRTLVSTDSQKIAKVAARAGADVPFLRPAKLAGDASPIEEAVRHALGWLRKNEGSLFDYVLLLQPTSPLRTATEIDQAIEYYFQRKKSPHDCLVSVTAASEKLGWLMRKDKAGYLHFCLGRNHSKVQRQKLPQYFLPNGAIYFAPVGVVMRRGFHGSRTIPFVMEEGHSIDVDSQEDLARAEQQMMSVLPARGGSVARAEG